MANLTPKGTLKDVASAPNSPGNRMTHIEEEISSIKVSLNDNNKMLARLLTSLSKEASINSEESISEGMLEPKQKLMQESNHFVVTAAPPKFDYYLTLKTPFDTFKFLEKYNLYKLSNPGVAHTMNLTAYVRSEMLSSDLGLRESVLSGRQAEMPDSLILQRIYEYWSRNITDPIEFCKELQKITFRQDGTDINNIATYVSGIYRYLHNIDTFHKFLVKCSANNDAIPDEAEYNRNNCSTVKYVINEKLSEVSLWEDHIFRYVRKDKTSWQCISSRIHDYLNSIVENFSPLQKYMNTHARKTEKQPDSVKKLVTFPNTTTAKKVFTPAAQPYDSSKYPTLLKRPIQDRNAQWPSSRNQQLNSVNATDLWDYKRGINEQYQEGEEEHPDLNETCSDEEEEHNSEEELAAMDGDLEPCFALMTYGKCPKQNSGCKFHHDKSKIITRMEANIKMIREN